MAFSGLSSALIVCPEYNSKGKSDATRVFQREAKALQKLYCIPDSQVLLFDNRRPMSVRADAVLRFVGAQPSGRLAAAFIHLGHGLPRAVQMGFAVTTTAKGHRPISVLLDALEGRIVADEIRAMRAKPGTFCFCYYSCSTGKGPASGDGNLADATRDGLCQRGYVWCSVLGHTESEHATMSPHARLMQGNGSMHGGVGGLWVVAPPAPQKPSPLWLPWNAALHSEVWPPLRLRFPFGFRPDGTRAEPHEYIGAVHDELDRARFARSMRARKARRARG